MPNRFLKDSITCSESIDALTWFQEVLYYRLIVIVDDFGRYYGDPRIIKSKLFPLKEEKLDRAEVEKGLKALEKAGMIKAYNWEGKPYIEIVHWTDHQQVRAKKSKFPDNNGSYTLTSDNNRYQKKSTDNKGKQKKSDDNICGRTESDSNTNTNTNTNTYNVTEEELFSIQADHNEILSAAEGIGLPPSPQNCKDLIDLYAEHGKEAVLYAISQAGRYNKISIAYIQKVAEGGGEKKPETEEKYNWLA